VAPGHYSTVIRKIIRLWGQSSIADYFSQRQNVNLRRQLAASKQCHCALGILPDLIKLDQYERRAAAGGTERSREISKRRTAAGDRTSALMAGPVPSNAEK
jgi:hypothetical protein